MAAAAEKPQSRSIHGAKGAPLQSAFLVVHLLGNCGLVLYSHLGLSFEVYTNAPPPASSPAPAPPPSPGATPPGPAPPPAPPASYESDTCQRRRLTAPATGCAASDVPQLRDVSALATQLGSCVMSCNLKLMRSATCGTTCIESANMFTSSCSGCMGEHLHCSAKFCLASCMQNPMSTGCGDCQRQMGCTADFDVCSGLNYDQLVLGIGGSGSQTNSTGGGGSGSAAGNNAPPAQKWYSLGSPGQISFSNSVTLLFEQGAIFLALVLTVASGVNPYLECILLGLAWFVPMPKERRGRLLWWINRAGRWSFLDIFLVVSLCTGLGTSLGPVELAIETRWSIYAFGIATIWARFLGLFVEAGHRKSAGQDPQGARLSCRCVGALSEKRLELVAVASSLWLLIFTAVGTAGTLMTFLVKSDAAGLENLEVYTPIGVGMVGSEKDLAGVRGALLLGVPYCLWGVLITMVVAVLLLLALALGRLGMARHKRLIIGLCDMAGSAASLDVLLLATSLAAHHFGEIVDAALTCVGGPIAEAVEASSGVGWAFFVLLAAVPAQWVVQETTLALHDLRAESAVAQEGAKEVKVHDDGDAELGKVEETNDTSCSTDLPSHEQPGSKGKGADKAGKGDLTPPADVLGATGGGPTEPSNEVLGNEVAGDMPAEEQPKGADPVKLSM